MVFTFNIQKSLTQCGKTEVSVCGTRKAGDMCLELLGTKTGEMTGLGKRKTQL